MTTTLKHPTVPETTPALGDVFPDFAVEPEEVERRMQQLRDYRDKHMTAGEDYGVLPGKKKAMLYKPGAEKLNALYGLSPVVKVTSRHEDWGTDFVAYEVKVTLLNKRTGRIEAEGVGSCNSRESRYKTQGGAASSNTCLKMAKKRALVDATLSATRSSGLFMQEPDEIAEDGPAPRQSNQSGSRNRPPAQHAPRRQVSAANVNDPASDRQKAILRDLAEKVFGKGKCTEGLTRMADCPLKDLKRGKASDMITELQKMQRNGGAQQ